MTRNWMASTKYVNDYELKLFKDVFLTDASICTTVSDGDVYLELGAGAKWYYDEDKPEEALAVSGAMRYDGDYFDATLMLGGEEASSAFSMPYPFGEEDDNGDRSIEIQSVEINYNGRDQSMSGAVVMRWNGFTLTANVDISSTSKGFELGVQDAALLDFLELFGSISLPDGIEDIFTQSTINGRLGWNSETGFEGEVTFTYEEKSLSFWFMYDSPNYSFLIKLPDSKTLGGHSGTVTSVAKDDGKNSYMIGYSKGKLPSMKGPKELAGQLFEDGLEIPDGFSVQVYVDTRPPTDGEDDNRVGIVKFIHDELKIHEITLSLALQGDAVELKISLGVDWELWEFEIYQIDLSIEVESSASLNVVLNVKAWCNLVKPAISTHGAIMFGFSKGQFELGIGLGFEGIIYDAFGVDGLRLKDVGFEGIIATLPTFPYIQPKGLYLQGYVCIDDDTCAGVMVYFSSSSPSAYYVAAEGTNWYLKDFIEWRMPKMKNKNLLNQIGFKKFELEIGASLEGALSGNTQFKRLDGSAVRRFDGSVLTLPGPMFRIDIEDFDFGIISGSRFMVDLTLGKNPKLRTEVDLDEINLGLFSIRDGQCRKRKGPRMKLEAWQGHFLLEAEGSVSKWGNCIGLTAKVNKEKISGCIKIDLRVRVKYPSCKCKWKGWKLKCSCKTKYKLIGLYESLCASVGISSGGRRALSTDDDWVPDTSDMGAELWELRDEILRKNGHRIKVIHDTLTEYNGVYADETGEMYMGFPVYRRLDNPDHIIHRFCVIQCEESENQPWVLTNTGEARSDIAPISYAYPTSMANANIDNDKPWRVSWDSLTVRWMSNFGSTEIAFRDQGVFKYQGEMRNGAPLYRDINDPSMILFEGDNTGDGLDDVSNRWIVAKQTEDSEGEEILEPQARSDYILNENDGPWETNWPQDENDFRHSLHSHVWSGHDLSEVPNNQWKAAVHIEDGVNVDFAFDGQAWDQTDRFDSDGSRIEPGYYRYPIQAIKISMNGVDRYFKLYLGENDYRWPGYAGYTLKDLLTTEVAQNAHDGVFYEHLLEESNDLWGLFETNDRNLSDSYYPTSAPTNHNPDQERYCVNDGTAPALDVNVDSEFENIFGRILIRRGINDGKRGSCASYEGVGLAGVAAGFHNAEGNHIHKAATIYVLPLPPSCSSFCPNGEHFKQDFNGNWICKSDDEQKIYCGCFTFLQDGACKECPINTWTGDAHHRLEQCIPERCVNECEADEHIALVRKSAACEIPPQQNQSLVALDDQCFNRTEFTMELECVANSGEVICDCESYLEDGECLQCPVGKWVGQSAHRLDDTYCLPKRLGEVPEEIPRYSFHKGFVAEDRPNILEILEQTTHEGFLDSSYVENQIGLTGSYATNLFGLSPMDDSIYKEKADLLLIGYQYGIANDLFVRKVSTNTVLYLSYYTKDKEVGYLARQVDILVERCIRHPLHCFVMNLVHHEMLASLKQLEEMKKIIDKEVSEGRDLPSLFGLLSNHNVSVEDLAAFHEANAELVVHRAQMHVKNDIEPVITELVNNLTTADDPRVMVSKLEIPSSSFMDSQRTQYYPIHGVLNFLGQNYTIDSQRKVGTNNDEFLASTEAMLGDIRRDIAVTFIARRISDKKKASRWGTKSLVRHLTREVYQGYEPALFNSYADEYLFDLSESEMAYDRESIYACTKPPRINAHRYKSMWEVWNYKEQEYVEVARGNANWEVEQQAHAGDIFLNDGKRQFLENINTVP